MTKKKYTLDDAFHLEGKLRSLKQEAIEIYREITRELEPLQLPNFLNACGVKDFLGDGYQLMAIDAEPPTIIKTKTGLKVTTLINVTLVGGKESKSDGQ